MLFQHQHTNEYKQSASARVPTFLEKNAQRFQVIGSFTEHGRSKGFFCSETVFNLSKKILTEAKTKVLEKSLNFAPIRKTLNEPKLRKNFVEFSHRMRCKWNFRNKSTNNFREIPAF